MLIVNADDWGGWRKATDSALACLAHGRITSVSAMVFMADSQRAADIATERHIDAGLHLNFTQPFSGSNCPASLQYHQKRLCRFLKAGRFAVMLYNPLLRESFRIVYRSQYEEFVRLYTNQPSHIDGHQHMHLCMNMLFDGLIQSGSKVRRSFSFWQGEKGAFNRLYRKFVDYRLARNYRLTDFFFCIGDSLLKGTLDRAIRLSSEFNVEMMAHPERQSEQAFLMSDDWNNILRAAHKGGFADL